MPRPFANELFTFTQPDGTTFVARGWGDQFAAVFEDEQGFTIVRDQTSGYYQYAALSDDAADLRPTGAVVGQADPSSLGLPRGLRASRPPKLRMASGFRPRWQERIAERRQAALSDEKIAMQPMQQTARGYVGLCVLVDFAGPGPNGTVPLTAVDDFCNKRGHAAPGSVRDYFAEVSGGKLDYTNLVPRFPTPTGYYRARNPFAYYNAHKTVAALGVRSAELACEVIAELERIGFDFGPLSADGSSYIRALNVFYAGTCSSPDDGLWPHSWHLGAPRAVAGGKSFYDYQVTNLGTAPTLGVFCHENGHMICDFPDLYDTGKKDGSARSRGVGEFCLMGRGGSGAHEVNPVRLCAYLRRLAGWAKTMTPGPGSPEYVLDLAAGDEVVMCRRNRTEYFLIENRSKIGRDATLPAAGLAIWHVDESGSNDFEGQLPAQHYECELEQADGSDHLEGGKNDGDAGDLFGAPAKPRFGLSTSPHSKWWDDTPSGVEVLTISPPGPRMTFRLSTPSNVCVMPGEAVNAHIHECSDGDRASVIVNGVEVPFPLPEPGTVNLTPMLHPGRNTVVMRLYNDAGGPLGEPSKWGGRFAIWATNQSAHNYDAGSGDDWFAKKYHDVVTTNVFVLT